MNRSHTRTTHEPEKAHLVPKFPPEYDEGVLSKDKHELEVRLDNDKVKLWETILPDGPKPSRIGIYLVVTMALILIVWVIIGFIRVFTANDTIVLTSASIMTAAFGAAVAYYRIERDQKPTGTRLSRQDRQLRYDRDTDSLPHE